MILLFNFVTALIFSAIGFIMYVYFFSVGYGFSVAAIGLLMFFMYNAILTPMTAVACILFVIYGVRLGAYLLHREWKSINYKNLLKGESKTNVPIGVKICIWIACALLYVLQTCPVLFRITGMYQDDQVIYIGVVMIAIGTIIEATADIQKTKAKKINPKSFVSTGLYRFVRCPNYFGELLLWTGVFVSGITVYNSTLQWICAILGYIGIIYVMFSGARRLELRQDKNYGHLLEYQQYVKTTPIIIPLVPIYSVKKYKWLVA